MDIFILKKILLFTHLAPNELKEPNVAELYLHFLGGYLYLCAM